MPNAVTTELFYDNAWNDITTDVRQLDPITVKWGRKDEAANISPSSLALRLTNPGGKYSPRNPTSPLFGKIGRNTPIRVRLGSKDASLEVPGVPESYASTPDHSSLDITGDIDVRMELKPASWRPPLNQQLASKYESNVGNQRAWTCQLLPTGLLWFAWSPDGTLAARRSATSTAAVPDDGSRRAVRFTVDVNNGAAGVDVKFYTASAIAGAWAQLGATVTSGGTSSIFSSTAVLEVGSVSEGNLFAGEGMLIGNVYAFQLLNGIGGTVVASPDFTAPQAGDVALTDSASRVWTLHGGAGIVDASVRFSGEVSAWPPTWDVSGKDVSVPLEAAGIRRRLGQGAPTLRSAMYRGLTGGNIITPRAYWPCDDGNASTSIASGLSGHPPMRVSGDVNLAAHSDLAASGPLPTFGTGYVQGNVPGYTVTNFVRCMALVDIPDSITGEPNILYLTTSGSVDRWYLSIDSGGDLRIRAVRRDDDVEVLNSLVDFNILGKSGLIWVYLTKTGPSSLEYQIGFASTDSTSVGVASGTVTSSIGIAKRVVSGGLGGNLGGMAVGHIVVLDTDEFWSINNFARAWTEETAVARITRLCAEEDVPLRIVGPAASSQRVGPQRVDTFLTLVDDAADADLGILVDDRDALRLLFRPGQTLYNQDTALTLDYATGQVAPALEPVEDDQATRNDITTKRPDGSSARAVLETGPLSVQAPPNGVGRYDTTETVIVADDAQLPHQASWLLHLGTVDEARYPQITVDLTATPSLTTAATAVAAGDRVQITNPPAWLPPDAIDQLAQGGTETLTPYRHTITFNNTPASPWTVAVADDSDLGRADTAGSQLASAATSAATSLSVATTVGPLWVTAAGEMPFDIRVGGEVMRVTAVSGASSPQTFTVVRSINNVTKAQAAGTDVALAQPAIAAL